MTTHYNGLSPAEAERLAYLIEECGEVIQAATKVLRHGYASINPNKPSDGSNRTQLARELGDVSRALRQMLTCGDLNGNEFLRVSELPYPTRYMHHQEQKP